VSRLHSSIDQENLQLKIDEWKVSHPGDSFLFRPYTAVDSCEVVDESNNADEVDGNDAVLIEGRGQTGLLIVYQSAWQKKMLTKYGELCLLDATYKTTHYAVPLFFLCVRTNVDYVVVATFITQYEDRASITEALKVVAGWNSEWTPQSFMVDFCDAEINSLEKVFPG
jgi:hypothetical protein